MTRRDLPKLTGITGTFWLDESNDYMVRREKQYWRFVRYIAENPIKATLAFLLSAFRRKDDEKGRQECLPHPHTRFLNGSISHSAGMALIDSRKKQPTVTIHESIRPVGGCIRIQ